MAPMIAVLADPGMPAITRRPAPYCTIETVSISRRFLISGLIPAFSSGSLSGRSIEPETSISNTKLLGGVRAISAFRPETFPSNNRLASFQGQESRADEQWNDSGDSGGSLVK